jgi:alkylation response protein AidB-like acyl-CoA dehydrogenase
MADYQAPVKDMLFVLRELAGLEQVSRLPGFEEATPDLVEAVLEEAAQFSAGVVAPTNAVGDTEGTRVENDGVVVPDVFKAIYRQYVENGWAGIAHSPDYGGQGLPHAVGTAVEEMLQSANLAWSLCPLLSQGAVRAIEAHASDVLKSIYLEKMVAGEWTGTMNLTEPQAGSDLSTVRTTAVPDGDAYRLSGQKIYITWGDHDMAENVIHLVLARLPDAPEGVGGISLFLVPKFLVDEQGNCGERNAVRPVSVEHKLGIHGSPTCVMMFDNALGYLVGPENRGLACMFTMMNEARLGVGLEGVAVSERSYQQAVAYARDRVQGRVPGHDERATIIQHPDVRRMLFTMRAHIEAMRALVYVTAAHLDHAHHAPDETDREYHRVRADLLTPIVKGWCTEVGQMLTSLGLQVHGGMGYVEETGAAQYYRDVRITTIYEGTTGIQANDLVGRKTLRDGGAAFGELLKEMRATVAELKSGDEPLASVGVALAQSVDDLDRSVDWVLAHAKDDPAAAGAASYHLLMLAGIVCGGWQLGRAALAAERALSAGGPDRAFLTAKLATSRFYAQQVMPLTSAHAQVIAFGSETLMGMPDEAF